MDVWLSNYKRIEDLILITIISLFTSESRPDVYELRAAMIKIITFDSRNAYESRSHGPELIRINNR